MLKSYMKNSKFKKIIYLNIISLYLYDEVRKFVKLNKPACCFGKLYKRRIKLVFRNKQIEDLFRLIFNDNLYKDDYAHLYYTPNKKEFVLMK
jgi:hypothetical protein